MEQDFILPTTKFLPLVVRYCPQLKIEEQTFFNPILGYPRCPMLARYNKGQYKLPETLSQIGFTCNLTNQGYKCAGKVINLPEKIIERLHNIPQMIPHNKGPHQQKNTKILDFHPIHFPPLKKLTVNWIISYGPIGKDFLNYINHTYIFGEEIFMQEKLKRNVHMLPIMVNFPNQSGFDSEQVERGISMQDFRSEYMSIHLKGGAPAFSPNNMRLCIEGMPKISNKKQANQQNKMNQGKNKKQKYKLKQKQLQGNGSSKVGQPNNEQFPCLNQIQRKETAKYVRAEQQKKQNEQQNNNKQEYLQLEQDLFQQQIKQQQCNKVEEKPKVEKEKIHQGFLHFYSALLLEQDYRVYYHWHVSDELRNQTLAQLLKRSKCIEQLVSQYEAVCGQDPMSHEIKRLLGWN